MESDSSSTLVARCLAVEARAIMIPKFFVFIRIWGTLRFLIFAFSGTTESDGPQFLLYLQVSINSLGIFSMSANVIFIEGFLAFVIGKW